MSGSDDCGIILHFDLIERFHAKLGEGDAFLRQGVLTQQSGHRRNNGKNSAVLFQLIDRFLTDRSLPQVHTDPCLGERLKAALYLRLITGGRAYAGNTDGGMEDHAALKVDAVLAEPVFFDQLTDLGQYRVAAAENLSGQQDPVADL